MIAVEITKKKKKKQKQNKTKQKQKNNNFIFKFGRVRLGIRVFSSHNFGNLGGQMKTRYKDAFGEKCKGDLYHERNSKLHGVKAIMVLPLVLLNAFHYHSTRL